MNSIDIIIVVVMLLFGALGIYWGFIRQVLSIVGLIAGVVLASRYGLGVADALASFTESDTAARALAFLFVFVAVSSITSFLATLLHRFVGLLFLGWLDHLIGGVLGLLQAALTCTVLLGIAAAVPNERWSTALVESQFAPVLVRLFGFILLFLPEPFRFAIQMIFGVP